MAESQETFKRLVIDQGNVELAFPDDWEVHAEEAGHLRMEPSDQRVRLEVSYSMLEARPQPPAVDRLREILRVGPPEPHDDVLVHSVMGLPQEVYWADYVFRRQDAQGQYRQAHARWLLATNGLLQALVSYHYWDDDAGWAVRLWEEIVPTLLLDRGRPAGGPPTSGKAQFTLMHRE